MLCEKLQWGKNSCNSGKKENKLGRGTAEIAWGSFELAMNEINNKKRRWIVKQTSGRCAVGVEMKRRREWSHAKCPRCDEAFETSAHVLQCTGEGTDSVWLVAVEDLRMWLAKQRTNNAVADVICSSLSAWRDGTTLHPPRNNLLGLRNAWVEQNDIGWDAAMEGRWSQSWIDIQDRHFLRIRKKRSGKRWLTAVIRRMWDISWDLWDHRNQVQLDRKKEDRRAKNSVNIRYEYGLGANGLDTHAAKLFEATLAEILTFKLSKQEAWLRRITLARKNAVSITAHQEQQNHLDFLNLLQHIRTRDRSRAVAARASTRAPTLPERHIRRISRHPPTGGAS
jgi:hypothetical protein